MLIQEIGLNGEQVHGGINNGQQMIKLDRERGEQHKGPGGSDYESIRWGGEGS